MLLGTHTQVFSAQLQSRNALCGIKSFGKYYRRSREIRANTKQNFFLFKFVFIRVTRGQFLPGYSYFNARNGSTFMARRAGM